jgi:hypothetical protein
LERLLLRGFLLSKVTGSKQINELRSISFPNFPSKMRLFFRAAPPGTKRPSAGSWIKGRGATMSTWFKDDDNPRLLAEAKQIAWEFLERSGEIDDSGEVDQFLTGKIEQMLGQGQRNRLVLSNRAIAAFREYRRTRTIELALESR